MTQVFKSSLFGYSKKSVCNYITEMSNECSRKLLEKDIECKTKLQEMEAVIEKLRQENNELRTGQHAVANALIDARKFADLQAKQAEEERLKLQKENTVSYNAEILRLKELADVITDLRKSIHDKLQSFDEELKTMDTSYKKVQEEYPPVYVMCEEETVG